MSLPKALDAPSRGTLEDSSSLNSTALLYVDGKARPAAIRPLVKRRSARTRVGKESLQKGAFVDQRDLSAKRGTGTIILDRASSNPQFRELSFGQFEIGAPPIPLDSADVESLRKSICLVGQTTPVLVREFPDGGLALLDGWGRAEALRLIGRTTISAIILSGLSDQEARLKQIVSNHRKKLSALDRALEDYEFLEIVRQKVSKGATPLGGRQPADKCHAKAAEELKVAPDRMARSERIARILPEAQAKIREFNLHNIQSVLLKVADAGDTADLQIAKVIELRARPKGKRAMEAIGPADVVTNSTTAGTPMVPADGGGSEMPDIPAFLRRDPDDIVYDQIKEEWARCEKHILAIEPKTWARCEELLLAVEPKTLQRFLDKCLIPALFPNVAAAAVTKKVPA